MALDRRGFSAMLAGTVLAPGLSFAQGLATKARTALYSGVGTELTHYEVDTDAATLTRRNAVKMPGAIQYAWPHPSRRYLYVTSSTGGAGYPGGPGLTGGRSRLAPNPHRSGKSPSGKRPGGRSTRPECRMGPA